MSLSAHGDPAAKPVGEICWWSTYGRRVRLADTIRCWCPVKSLPTPQHIKESTAAKQAHLGDGETIATPAAAGGAA
jgi:hypothetical protein